MLPAIIRFTPYLFFIASLAVVLVYVLLGHFAFPSADDFCMASGVRDKGLLPHLSHHYMEWSGRYASNTFYALYPLIFGLSDGYQLLPFGLLLLLFLAMVFLLATVFSLPMRNPVILLMSLGFLVAFITGMRDTASSLYWMAGAMTYQTANILMLVMLGLMVRLFGLQSVKGQVTGVTIMLMVVIMLGIGTHETNMMLIALIVGAMLLMRLPTGWSNSHPWLMLLVVVLICGSIVVLAPGNLARESTFPMRHDFTRAVQGSYAMGLKTLGIWLLSPLMIVISLMLPIAMVRLRASDARTIAVSRWHVVLLLLFTFSIPFALQFPAWWAMGGYPPARTVDAIYFVFLVGWFTTIAALSTRYLNLSNRQYHDSIWHSRSSIIFLLATVCLIAALATNGKFTRALKDLFYHAGPYHEYMQNRLQLIQNAVENKQYYLAVPEFNGEYPRSIYYNDIRRDPRDWRNACYADYYGLRGISRAPLVRLE